MSAEEEILSKWGNVELTLDSYFKFVFVYSGKNDTTGETITVAVGGSGDNIYKFSPNIHGTTPLCTLLDEASIMWIEIHDKDGASTKTIDFLF
jgi:hypothetical protein